MNALGLSHEQLASRRKRIHAGDAAAIMEGRWREVWLKKTGRVAEDDLSGEFRVQLGSYTEPFNLYWTMRQTGREIEYFSANMLMREIWLELTGGPEPRSDELQVSKTYPWMACNLDGMSTTPQGKCCPIDAKHVGRADELMIVRYTAAMTHQATVMDCDWWALAPIVGNKWVPPIYQEVDPLYQATLIAKEREFFGYVERDEEPPDMTPKLAPKPQPRLRTLLLDELTHGGTDWPNWAGRFIALARDFAETDGAAKKHAIVRKEITALVPEDVGLVRIGLVEYKRDGRGQTITLKKGKDDGEAEAG